MEEIRILIPKTRRDLIKLVKNNYDKSDYTIKDKNTTIIMHNNGFCIYMSNSNVDINKEYIRILSNGTFKDAWLIISSSLPYSKF